MESWYPADSTSPWASARGGGSGRLGSSSRAHLPEHQDEHHGGHRDPGDGQDQVEREGRAGEGHEGGQAERAHQPVGADAQ